jgi:uncharacterized protein (TIGR03437 family)
MLKRVLLPCLACLVFAAAVLQAQTAQPVLFVLPGGNSNAVNVTALATTPLSQITAFQAGAGSFLLFAKPDNSRFYLVGTSPSQTVTSVDNTFQSPRNILSLTPAAMAAAMTPDGKHLAVVNGNSVHIINTTTDTDMIPSGINLGTGINVIDVAVSLDGTKFYTLGTSSSGSQLNAIDVTTGAVIGTLGIQGQATAVAVGPNALIYVSTQNLVVIVNPTTLKPTPGGSIPMNARPGRLVFTPDGKYALAPNLTPVTGSAVLLFAVANQAIVNTVPSFGIVMDSLQVVASNKILGYSSENQSVYQFTIGSTGGLDVTAFNVPGSANSTTGITVSNEVPAGAATAVQSVYAVNSDVVYQLDSTGVTKGQSPLPKGTQTGPIFYTATTVISGAPATILQYGIGQTIATNSTSEPLVVRVLDANSHPMGGVTVTFATTSTTSTLSATTVVTQDNGFAEAYLNSGAANGPVQVTATAGTHNVAFTVNVGISTGGSAGGLSIVAGQGQLLPGGNSTLESGTSLVVKVTNPSGAPLAGAPVTFRVSQGTGSLFLSSSLGGSSVTPNTDANGLASTDFLSQEVLDLVNRFTQTQITASAPGTNTVTFFITALTHVTNGLEVNVRQLQPATGTVLSGKAGGTLTGALQIAVASISSVPIPNVAVVLNDTGVNPTVLPTAKCNDPNGTGVLSNTSGIISCDIVLGPVVGSLNIAGIVGSQVTMPPFGINISPGPPGIVKIVQGNNQSGSPGKLLPQALKVHVTDSAGNSLPGTPVTWQVVTPGSVILTNVSTITDSSGFASATATLGSGAGAFQVNATAGTASASFTLSVLVPSVGIQLVSGDGQNTTINAGFPAPLVVKVVDANNNGVPGVQVAFQVTTGSATLGTPTATTDSSGQASTTVQASSTAGTIVVTASSNGFNVTFTLTAQLPGPTNLAIVNGASFSAHTGVSPGGIAIITGNRILSGVNGLVTAFNIVGPLPTVLGGASIFFGGVPAPIYYVMNSSGTHTVAVQVPFEVQPGPVTVNVNAGDGGSASLNVNLLPFAPGIFATASGGHTYAVAVRPDGSFVSPSNPAHRGENISLYVTGLGDVTPATATGDAGVPGQVVVASLNANSEGTSMIVGLNNSGVPLISAVYAPGMVGVYVVTFEVPANTQTGPAQPLGLILVDAQGNNHFAQGISMAVQ